MGCSQLRYSRFGGLAIPGAPLIAHALKGGWGGLGLRGLVERDQDLVRDIDLSRDPAHVTTTTRWTTDV